MLRQLAVTGVPFRPGARELLADLRAHGVKTALVTMSMRRMALSVADLIDFPAFDLVVAGDDVDKPKPHPDPYLQAARELGVDIRDTVAIEDSPNGLRSAIASGAVSLGVPLMVPLEGVGAHSLWSSLEGRTTADLRALHAAHASARTDETQVTDERDPPPERPLPHRRSRPADRPEGPHAHDHPARGGELHTHNGVLKHALLVDQPDGSVVTNSSGHDYLAVRPLLRDFVMSMPRGAAIVYPKDAAQILAQADVFPGATVVEAGVGSGALSLWLLRAIGPAGRLLSFERREEFADVARANVETFHASFPRRGRSSWAISSRACRMPWLRPPSTVSSWTCWRRGSASTPSPTPSRPAAWCSATSPPPRS